MEEPRPELKIVSPRSSSQRMTNCAITRGRGWFVTCAFDDGSLLITARCRACAHKGAAFTGRQPVLRSLPMMSTTGATSWYARLQVLWAVRHGILLAKSEHLGMCAGVLLDGMMGRTIRALNFDDPKLAANASVDSPECQLFQFQPGA